MRLPIPLFLLRLRAVNLGAMLIIALVIVGAVILPSGAQPVEPGFAGQVTDIVTGEPIVKARIQVGEVDTYTDAAGRYRLPATAGVHDVRAVATGYIGMTETRQSLAAGQTARVDFQMWPESLTPAQEEALLTKMAWPMQEAPDPAELIAAAERAKGTAAIQEVPRTIRVLMPDGTVVEMDFEEYLKGVVPQEMPPAWPMEALKAQAVAARSYAATTFKHAHEGADVCTTTHCQVWKSTHYDTTDQAVDETHGVSAKYNGSIITAFFHAHCDGHTRNVEDVWTAYLPYCRSVACPCGFAEKLGHGVGMCQHGARVLAEQGKSYQEILQHYYTGIQVIASAPPQLEAGQVSPASGNTYTRFTFEITYRDADGDPPAEAVVIIDGLAYAMMRRSGDFRTGALYAYETTLAAGDHAFRFSFDDGFGHTAQWPAVGETALLRVAEAPRDAPTPTPTPTAQPGETRAGQWAQTTMQDWADGVLENMVIKSVGNGALALASAALAGAYTSPPFAATQRFMALGSNWLADLPTGTSLSLALRASEDGQTWSDWQTVELLDAERDGGPPYGELVFVVGRYIQYRVALQRADLAQEPLLHSLTITYIDTVGGPSAVEARLRALSRGPAVAEGPVIISRAEWGARPDWMTWEPEYRAPKTFIIHHTVTSSGGTDPAAVVRAIYYYHAVTNGWGDIGYNYLVDDRGNIYEGRYGGEGVVGGHARAYNLGSIGVAVLGDYTSTAPSAAAIASLVELLAAKGNLHFIHPQQSSFFIDKVLPNIMGHRDTSSSTTCPGDGFYALLPNVRVQVMDRMKQLTPNAQITQPVNGALLRGPVTVSARGSPAVTSLRLWLDDVQQASSATTALSWRWDTAASADGIHQLRVSATTAAGRSYEQTVQVRVDNTPPTGGVSLVPFVNARDVTLALDATGASYVQWGAGWLWEGEALYHQVNTGREVADAAALNGKAWYGRAGSDQQGLWFGPYYCGLPVGQSYQVYFRLKTPASSGTNEIARLDVVDSEGTHVFLSRSLTAASFESPNRYIEIPLDFTYASQGSTCADPTVDDGLEFRTRFMNVADLYLDRVHVFTAPQPLAPTLAYQLDEVEGRHDIQVRYIDDAGNRSPVYTATTVLDVTPPLWLGGGGDGYALVSDVLSGLDVNSGTYATSTDQQSWSAWQPATISAPQGATIATMIRGSVSNAGYIRFRVRDRAGNESVSPAYAVSPSTPVPGVTPTVTATPTSQPTRMRVITLPLILRDYDPLRGLTPEPPTVTPTPEARITIIVRGKAYDAVRGIDGPLADVHVVASVPALNLTGEAQSDAAGEYRVEFAVPFHVPGARVSVIGERAGYQNGWNQGTLSAEAPGGVSELTLDLPLLPLAATPTPTATAIASTVVYVHGTIYDADSGPGVGIGDVEVVAYLAGRQSAAISDATGAYSARLEVMGEISGWRVDVLASKSGYSPALGYALLPSYPPGGLVFVRVDVGIRRSGP